MWYSYQHHSRILPFLVCQVQRLQQQQLISMVHLDHCIVSQSLYVLAHGHHVIGSLLSMPVGTNRGNIVQRSEPTC